MLGVDYDVIALNTRVFCLIAILSLKTPISGQLKMLAHLYISFFENEEMNEKAMTMKALIKQYKSARHLSFDMTSTFF